MKYKLRNNYPLDANIALEYILQDRGVIDIEGFLNPSEKCELNPYDLDNITIAAEMLLKHLRANNSIVFVVDCDCDGFTSSSILWLYIKNIFPDADLDFIVHEHKQHGLSDLIELIENKPSCKLVICPDAASYDIKEHERLYELGIDCLILDHHSLLLDDDGNPIISDFKNTIIVNNQLSEKYNNKSLCGAGVVYKFCEVLDDILGIKKASFYKDLVALGEIADVMDRTNSETNYLMLDGLQHINNLGFRTLLESQSFSLKEKAEYPYVGLTPIDIAFYIAPLINAITRVGTIREKKTMFYCFIEPNREVESTKRGAKLGDIELAAEQTARVGKNAKSRQDKLKEKALDVIDFKIQKNDLLQNNILVIEINEQDNIPQELTGLVAMGIVSKYNKPCLLVRRNSNNLLQGSARSNGNFAEIPNLKQYEEDSGFFEYVAGHDNAHGIGIKANQLDNFLSFSNKNLSAAAFENCYTVDYVLDARENHFALLLKLASHPEYFGNHIEEIKVILTNISLARIMVMGANKDSIKISFNGIDFIKFKDIDFINKIMDNRMATLTVLGRLNLNHFAGQTNLQMFIDDYELITPNKYDF
jgi:single-stranded-DNA-specific exonuclease